LSNTAPTADLDDYARGWRAAVSRWGELLATIADSPYDRAAVNDLYRRLVAEGVPGHTRTPSAPDGHDEGAPTAMPGGGWLSGPCLGGADQ
jgi:hypothetical protein